MHKIKHFNKILQDFSIPLILGVLVSLVWANFSNDSYQHFLHFSFIGDKDFFGHVINFHFLFNDLFMVLFFGIAAVEITKAVSPNGPLFPLQKAMNPILSCLGGVIGPVVFFFLLTHFLPLDSLMKDGIGLSEINKGWAIPTATDIALAWFLASIIFGKAHPAVSFLLVLAIIDDAIGLGIIAIFYPTPGVEVILGYLFLSLFGVFIAFVLRMRDVHNIVPYLLAGVFSWSGLFFAHLHPALALIFIVPFMPQKISRSLHEKVPALDRFEHNFKYIVDVGLFGFALANAGVLFSSVNELTLIIFISLFFGKMIGITFISLVASAMGFSLSKEINFASLIVLSMIAGLGLTVALFVAGVAYTDATLSSSAKMGALLSVLIIPIAWVFAKILGIKKISR